MATNTIMTCMRIYFVINHQFIDIESDWDEKDASSGQFVRGKGHVKCIKNTQGDEKNHVKCQLN